MKLLILGATGPTGRCLLDGALGRGDQVTALARNPAALADVADRITVVPGDATSQDDVARAMAGQDAVVSALGTGKSLTAGQLFSRASAAVTAVASKQGVTRLVWLSSFGVGKTFQQANPVQKVGYRTLLRGVYADKKIADDQIRSSGLDWTLVYPVLLTNGPATGNVRAGAQLQTSGAGRMSRADVAAFMLQAAHDGEWARRDAVITY